MNSIYDIKNLLSYHFSEISFLQSEDITKDRFDSGKPVFFLLNSTKVIKFISYNGLSSESVEIEKNALFREYEMVTNFVNNPGVIRAFTVNEFIYNNYPVGAYIIFERLPYTVQELLNSSEKFHEYEVKKFLRQMGNVLEDLHFHTSVPVIHSDIKPSNIGVRETKNGKSEYVLFDFGVSVDNSGSYSSNVSELRGLTPAYSAPEQIKSFNKSSGFITAKVDIYAVGVIALEMLTGLKPRKDENSIVYEIPMLAVPARWQTLISSLCAPNPDSRPDRITISTTNQITSLDPKFVKPKEKNHTGSNFFKDRFSLSIKPNLFAGVSAAIVLIIVIFSAIMFFTSNSNKAVYLGGNDSGSSSGGQIKTDENVVDDSSNRFMRDYQVSSSGLRYRIIERGFGRRPLPSSTVVFHYKLVSSRGEVIRDTNLSGDPLRMTIRSLRDQISGLSEGLQMMRVGSVYEFSIPEYLAFSDGQSVQFNVELLAVY